MWVSWKSCSLKKYKPLFIRGGIRLTELCFGQNFTKGQIFEKINTNFFVDTSMKK